MMYEGFPSWRLRCGLFVALPIGGVAALLVAGALAFAPSAAAQGCEIGVTELHAVKYVNSNAGAEIARGYFNCHYEVSMTSWLCMRERALAGNWVLERCSHVDTIRGSGSGNDWIHNLAITGCRWYYHTRRWRADENGDATFVGVGPRQEKTAVKRTIHFHRVVPLRPSDESHYHAKVFHWGCEA